MTKIRFSLSPSSINLFMQSELQFYCSYIAKLPADTKTIEVYGLGGNVVHEVIDEYIKSNLTKTDEELKQIFNEKWTNKDLQLQTSVGLNGKILKIEEYLKSCYIAKHFLKTFVEKHKIVQILSEESISFDLYSDEIFDIKLKGIIDCQLRFEQEGQIKLTIVDWKTSSSVDSGENFKRQGLHYCLLVYKKYNIIPTEVIFKYVKINKQKSYSFELKELQKYEQFVQTILNKIISKGSNPDNYTVGEYNNIFNSHLNFCQQQALHRTKTIIMSIKNNYLHYLSLPTNILKLFDTKYSYEVPGKEFSSLYQMGRWDGKKHLVTATKMPYSFINDVRETLEDYGKYFNININLILQDKRNKEILQTKYNTKFKPAPFKLHYYQEEAVNAALSKKIGILFLGTGAGKSYIASEIIRRTNVRTLFLVNRIELLSQTKEMFESYLGIKIGTMSEGELSIDNQITIASIQTLYSILQRQDSTTTELKQYLSNVVEVIYDECQNVSKLGMYGKIQKELTNVDYMLALSGSPWRNDGTTLEMNALCGFIIYQKTTEELEQEQYLTSTKCYFINYVDKKERKNYNSYVEEYVSEIVENEKRNKLIYEIVERFKTTKKILVLTRRIKHAKLLGDLIPNSFVITGSSDSEYRHESFKKFKEDKYSVLIGSLKIFSAGIDIPDLDIIINATGHKSTVDTIQIVGRVKRKTEGKSHSYFIDFNDVTKSLSKSAICRKEMLASFGNVIEEVSKEELFERLI